MLPLFDKFTGAACLINAQVMLIHLKVVVMLKRHIGSPHLTALIAAFFTFAAIPQPSAAQVAIPIDEAQMATLMEACVDADACTLAIENLVETLFLANREVPMATILGSVAAVVSTAYNEGRIRDNAVARTAMSSLATVAEKNGSTNLAASLRTALEAVVAGVPINLQAVAEASASPT